MLRCALRPTADMHIGNLQVAIFNFIVAKQRNEELMVRIEDTNKEKNIEGKDKEILELLSLFSIDYKTITYQSENLKYHQKMAMQLMSLKKAFACFCSDEKLEELKKEANEAEKLYAYDGFCATLSDETVLNCNAPFTIRMAKPADKIQFGDLINGKKSYSPSEVDAFFILNHEKLPTYDYACAVDDMINDISVVIRSEEFIDNTPKQIHVRHSFGYDKELEYVHVPTIKDAQRVLVQDLINQGFLPSAIANYLVSLSIITPLEIFSLEEAIEWFDIKSINVSNIEFDIEQLRIINKKHLEQMDDMRLSKILGFADSDIGKLGKLFLVEVSTINEIKDKLTMVFEPKEALSTDKDAYTQVKEALMKAPYFDKLDALQLFIKEETSLDEKKINESLCYILTGDINGPSLLEVYPLLKNYIGEIVK